MAMGRARGQAYGKLERVCHQMETLGREEECWKTPAKMVRRDKEGRWPELVSSCARSKPMDEFERGLYPKDRKRLKIEK